MIDLFLTAFVFALFAAGMRKPFIWVLAYVYIDVLAPQKISWFLLEKLPISLMAFGLAFLGWAYADAKNGSRFTFRQVLIAALLLYCGATTMTADFPDDALAKWDWVWKALIFAVFLPLTLRTRLRIESTALVMTLTAGAIIIPAGIKTLASGGGYGSLHLLVNDNVGLYEGSILSTVAIAIIPLALWLANHGTIFRPDWRVKLFAWGLCFACALMPVGTEARTGLVCLAILIGLSLRDVKRRFLYVALIGAAGLLAVPFLPASFSQRMETIGDHKADQSASTRLAVWSGPSSSPRIIRSAAGSMPIARTGWRSISSIPKPAATPPRSRPPPSRTRRAPIIRHTSRCSASRAIRASRCGCCCTGWGCGRWSGSIAAIAATPIPTRRGRIPTRHGSPRWHPRCNARRSSIWSARGLSGSRSSRFAT